MQTNAYVGGCSEETFEDLAGLRWIGTVACGMTRHFYFAACSGGGNDGAGEFTIGVECAWRIEGPESIIVGRDDYFEPAPGNDAPGWDSEDPRRDLQDHLIVELLGNLKEGGSESPDSAFVVDSIRVDSLGGFRIAMSGGYTLAVFPSSRSQMEWIYLRPGRASLVYMNGRVSRTNKKGQVTPLVDTKSQ